MTIDLFSTIFLKAKPRYCMAQRFHIVFTASPELAQLSSVS